MAHQLLMTLLRKSDFMFVAGQFPREIDFEMKITVHFRGGCPQEEHLKGTGKQDRSQWEAV